MSSKNENSNPENVPRAQDQEGAWNPEKTSSTTTNFFYFEKTATCDRHDGVKVVYELSKHSRCPLCAALNKIAYYETLD